MNTDEKYGRLRCISTGEEGSYLYGPQPFEFIAADSIDVNATVVEIEASVSTGGGGASSITSGTKDTITEGTGSMPAGLMMKMQASKSEIGITGSTQASAKERITTRSMEKLRKRLYAIREKSNNKSQFDRIIEKIEARLAGTNGVTKNTIITPKPLAKTGQIVMSYFCELPIAHVTIEKSQYPPCNDQTSYDYLIPQVVNDPNDMQGGGGCMPIPLKYEPPSVPQPPEDFIDPVVCYNETQSCVGLMIPNVYAYIPLRIGTCPTTAIQVETKDDIKDLQTAQFVIAELNNQINRIDEIIKLLGKNSLPLPNGSKIQNFEKVWSRNSIYVHEQQHATWWYLVMRDAINEIKVELPACRPWDEVKDMTTDQIKDTFKPPAWKIVKYFTDAWERINNEHLNDTEKEGHKAQKKYLEKLVESIEKKFNLLPQK
jgi:hypothetical protein